MLQAVACAATQHGPMQAHKAAEGALCELPPSTANAVDTISKLTTRSCAVTAVVKIEQLSL